MAAAFGGDDEDWSWDIDRVLAGFDGALASGGYGDALVPARMIYRLRGTPDPAAGPRESFFWIPLYADWNDRDLEFPAYGRLATRFEHLAQINGPGRRGPRITAALIARAISCGQSPAVAVIAAMLFDRTERRGKDRTEARLAWAAVSRMGFSTPLEIWQPTSKTVLPGSLSDSVEEVLAGRDLSGEVLLDLAARSRPGSSERARAMTLLGIRLAGVMAAGLGACRPALVRIITSQRGPHATLTPKGYEAHFGKDVVGFTAASGSEAWRDLPAEELARLVWEMPKTALALRFGVSDRAIAKRCMKLGIEVPPIGYWRITPGEEVARLVADERSPERALAAR